MSDDATILVVDDQPVILENLELLLTAEGYRVLTARDGMEALVVLESNAVDLIVADIAMPRLNGYQLYERVRERAEWLTMPFLFLTARAMDSDVRYGKELGVDDYLTKPIQPEDLLAAVQGRLRRARQLAQVASPVTPLRPNGPPVLKAGRLKIDPGQHRVWMGEKEIALSAREFVLLERLAESFAQVISPQELVEVTHDLETDSVEAGSLIRPLIRSLRRKLGYPVGETGCIENVRGVGYRLVRPEDS